MAKEVSKDIKYRISNLEEITNQLQNIKGTVTLKETSGLFSKLEKLERGITINIKFDDGGFFRKLEELQSKGIKLNSKESISDAEIAKIIKQREDKINAGFEKLDLNDPRFKAAKSQPTFRPPNIPYLDLERSNDFYPNYLDFSQVPKRAPIRSKLNSKGQAFSAKDVEEILSDSLEESFRSIKSAKAPIDLTQIRAIKKEELQVSKEEEAFRDRVRSKRYISPDQQALEDDLLIARANVQREQLAKVLKARQDKEAEQASERAEKLKAKQEDDFAGFITGKNPNFNPFKLSRLSEPGAIEKIGFSALFGNAPATIGATIGTVAGAGPVLGAALGDAVGRALTNLKERLEKASEAAQDFERAISGTAGVIGANLRTFNKETGDTLSPVESLKFREAQGEIIQRAARQALLPLGVNPEIGNALTGAFVQSRVSQGFLPNADVTKTLLERFGAFTTLADKGITPTQAARDVRDILLNSPRASATQLGVSLKPITPELFTGKTLNDQELLKATEKLQAFVDAVKNSNEFVTQRLRLEGQLATLTVDLGEALNKSLIPGFKTLNEVLANPTLTKALNEIASALGSLASDAIIKTAEAIRDLAQNKVNQKALYKEEIRDNPIAGSFRNAIAIDPTFKQAFEEVQAEDQTLKQTQANNELLRNRGIKLAAPTSNVGQELTPAGKFDKFLRERGFEGISEKEGAGVSGAISETEVTSKNNPFLALGIDSEAIKRAREEFSSSVASEATGIKAENLLPQTDSLKLIQSFAAKQFKDLEDAFKSKESTFDTTIEGRLGLNKFKRESLVTPQVSSLSTELQALEDRKLRAPLATPEYKQIVADIEKVEDQLNSTRVKALQVDRETISLENEKLELSQKGLRIDEALKNAPDILTKQIANLQKLPEGEERNADIRSLQRKLEDNTVAQIQNRQGVLEAKTKGFDTSTFAGTREFLKTQEETFGGRVQAQLDLVKNARSEKEKAEAQAGLRQLEGEQAKRPFEKLKAATAEGVAPIQFKDLTIKFQNSLEELADKSKELADAFKESTNAISDFDNQLRLRELGRQGEAISLAEKLQKGGDEAEAARVLGSVGLTPFSITEEGKKNFETTLAGQQANDFINRNSPIRIQQEEAARRRSLVNNQNRIGREIEEVPIENRNAKLSYFNQSLDLAEKFAGSNSKFSKEIKNKVNKELLPDIIKEFGIDASVFDFQSAPPVNLGSFDEKRRKISSTNFDSDSRDKENLFTRLTYKPLEAKGLSEATQSSVSSANNFLDYIKNKRLSGEELTSSDKQGISEATRSLSDAAKENARNVGEAAKKTKEEQTQIQKDLIESLKKDTRTLNQLSKADLLDAITSGATSALNSHFT